LSEKRTLSLNPRVYRAPKELTKVYNGIVVWEVCGHRNVATQSSKCQLGAANPHVYGEISKELGEALVFGLDFCALHSHIFLVIRHAIFGP
jgi:uncharacterized membrane protein